LPFPKNLLRQNSPNHPACTEVNEVSRSDHPLARWPDPPMDRSPDHHPHPLLTFNQLLSKFWTNSMKRQSSNDSGILSGKKLKFVAAWQGNTIAAARAAGYKKPKNMAFRLMQDPTIADEIRRKQRIMTEESAKRIAAQLSFDRSSVLNRLWEIAQIAPDKTNNTLSSQVKAAEALAAAFDAELKHVAEILPHLSGKSEEDVQFWVRHGHFPSTESGESQ
jgi:hypothetical protein